MAADPALALDGDHAGSAGVLDRDVCARLDRELARREELLSVDAPVDDPPVHPPFALGALHGQRLEIAGVLEMGAGVEVPVDEVDDVVEVLLLGLRHVLDEERPGDAAALDHRLEHREDIASPLGLVGQDRARGVKDAGRDEPAGARLQAIAFTEVEHSVVADVPVLQAAADVLLPSAGLEAVVRVRKVVAGVVELRREVITFGLALLADGLGLLVVLVHVAGNGPEVVEEFRIDGPALELRPDRLADDPLALRLHGVAEREALAVVDDVAQALVRLAVVVGRLGGRAQPSLVDAAPVGAHRVVVVRVELEAAAGREERARHPTGREAQHTLALLEGLPDVGFLRNFRDRDRAGHRSLSPNGC